MNGSSSSSSRINNDSTRCDEAKLGDVSRGADGNALDKVMSVASGDDSMKGYLNYLDDEASKSRKISCRSNYEKPISSFLKDVKSRDVKRVRDASSALWTLAGNCK